MLQMCLSQHVQALQLDAKKLVAGLMRPLLSIFVKCTWERPARDLFKLCIIECAQLTNTHDGLETRNDWLQNGARALLQRLAHITHDAVLAEKRVLLEQRHLPHKLIPIVLNLAKIGHYIRLTRRPLRALLLLLCFDCDPR